MPGVLDSRCALELPEALLAAARARPDDAIDYEAPRTPYRQLAAILRARIARGDRQQGRAAAGDAQLVQQYGLARSTVRRTVALLVGGGVLSVVPQRGTYVATAAGR
ncbi:GntR family transcriptional regulator [Streptomyces sp. NRRL B-24484]|uniref:GntR family transcriptional regulator n=1 Tax=Streptomyces sp. NRRL B-24484 TaxID=1463833 RepID=UPI002D21E0FB|nr:GntR family transcriptional regulator [Streptomyces sp. NRRL B-24484]